MEVFRKHVINRLFALFLGAAFLNMSFFLTEIRMLDLDLDKDLIENIAEMIFNVGLEEERDVFEDVPEEGKGKTSVDFFVFSGKSYRVIAYLIHENRKGHGDADLPLPGSQDILTPPPKA